MDTMKNTNAKKKNPLGVRDFAALVNLDKRRVQQLANEGVIQKSGRGQYPVSEVTHYIEYLQELAQSRGIDPERGIETDHDKGYLDPNRELARKNAALADMMELKLAVEKGELLNAREVGAKWTEHVLSARNRLLSMGSRLAPRLMAAQGDGERKLKVIIDEAVHQALQELADEE